MSTFSAMQANGRGGYVFKTIDPYVEAPGIVLAFLRRVLHSAYRWYLVRSLGAH